MVDAGIILIKYWLEVSPDEQTRRLESRIHDPRKIWKLTDMDLLSYSRWYDYSRARDKMLVATDTVWAPWFIARTDDKKRGRLNIISHLLSHVPYEPLAPREITLPKRQGPGKYVEPDLSSRFRADPVLTKGSPSERSGRPSLYGLRRLDRPVDVAVDPVSPDPVDEAVRRQHGRTRWASGGPDEARRRSPPSARAARSSSPHPASRRSSRPRGRARPNAARAGSRGSRGRARPTPPAVAKNRPPSMRITATPGSVSSLGCSSRSR